MPLFDEADPTFAAGVGVIRGLRVERLVTWKPRDNPTALLRLETRLDDVEMRSLVRHMPSDVAPATPFARVRDVPASWTLHGTTRDGGAGAIDKVREAPETWEVAWHTIDSLRVAEATWT